MNSGHVGDILFLKINSFALARFVFLKLLAPSLGARVETCAAVTRHAPSEVAGFVGTRAA